MSTDTPTAPATNAVLVPEVATSDLHGVRKALAAAGWQVISTTATRGACGYSDITIAPVPAQPAAVTAAREVRAADVKVGDHIKVGGKFRTVARIHPGRGLIGYRVQGSNTGLHFLSNGGPDALVTAWR